MKNRRIGNGANIACPLALFVFAFSAVLRCAGQSEAAPQAPTTASKPYTLHAYEDLVQVPALVVNAQYGTYLNLGQSDFAITLDSGPPFQPSHLRPEGEDPVNLAFLVDASVSGSQGLSASLLPAASNLEPDVLSPTDLISVFAFDCSLIRSSLAMPASTSLLTSKISEALEYPTLHRSRDRAHGCRKHFGLWDAIGEVANEMRGLPGRRVVLLFTDGKDNRSENSVEAVRRFAASHSITVFALRPPPRPIDLTFGPSGPGKMLIDFEEKLGLFCSGTGGVSFVATPKNLTAMMDKVIRLLRTRYILEFPRPSNGAVGYHEIAVTLTKDPNAIIRVGGASTPLRDPRILADPNTVPNDTAKQPVMGKRRVIPDPK